MYVWYVVYIYLLFTQVSTYLSKTMGPCHIKSATEKKQQGKKSQIIEQISASLLFLSIVGG